MFLGPVPMLRSTARTCPAVLDYRALCLNGRITTLGKFGGRNACLWLAQSSGNTAMRYHDPGTVSGCEGVMIREDIPGSVWASVLAILSVTGTIGALYLPLVLN
jgi:hypothetical protein